MRGIAPSGLSAGVRWRWRRRRHLRRWTCREAWAPRFSEDQPERIPGPELGDYLGLPITDGARQWALSWDPSRLTLPEHQCQVHVSPYIYRGPLQLRIWEERDPDTQQLIAIKNYISTYEQTRTIWMDGRPHPPEYAAHTWEGFSTGQVRRRHAHGDDDAHQAGVGAPQRPAGKRQRDAQRALHPSRQRAHAHLDRHGPGVSHRAADQDAELRHSTIALQIGAGAWLWPCEYVDESRTVRRASCRTTSWARIPTSRSSWTGITCRSTRRWAAPRRCIPSISWSSRS